MNDILVVVEKNPHIVSHNGTPCPKIDPKYTCMLEYQSRALNLYLGSGNGRFPLAFSNPNMVLQGDEGGVFGDPLKDLARRANGSVEIGFHGGSAQRWGFTYVMALRSSDLYVVGIDELNYDSISGALVEKSTNLITGQVVEKSQRDLDAQVVTKRSRVSVRPLLKVSAFKGL